MPQSKKGKTAITSLILALLACAANHLGLFAPAVHVHAQQEPPISGLGTINWTPVAVLPPTTGTLTGYQLVGMTTLASASPAFTLPTATALCSLFPNPYASTQGFNWDWYLRNDGAGIATLLTNTGWTVPALTELRTTAGKVRHYRVGISNTSCGSTSPTATLHSLGEATP